MKSKLKWIALSTMLMAILTVTASYSIQLQAVQTCPDGKVWDGFLQRCVCLDGYVEDPSTGRCVCITDLIACRCDYALWFPYMNCLVSNSGDICLLSMTENPRCQAGVDNCHGTDVSE